MSISPQPASAPVSPLRQRMLEDMVMHGLRTDTQRNYNRIVRSFAAFLGRPPDTATAEDLRRFQVHQRESGMQPQSINNSVSELRFFLTVTLNRPDLSRRLVLVRLPRKLLDLLSVGEVGQLLEAAPNLKYKAAEPVSMRQINRAVHEADEVAGSDALTHSSTCGSHLHMTHSPLIVALYQPGHANGWNLGIARVLQRCFDGDRGLQGWSRPYRCRTTRDYART